MNGIDKITEKIIGDALSEAQEIIARTEKEAAGIVSEREAKAAASANVLVAAAEAEAKESKLRIHGAADLERRKAILAAKQETIDRAFELSLERLESLPAEAYIEVVSRIAVNGVWTGSEEVVMSASDAKKQGKKMVESINRLLKEKGMTAGLTLSKSTRDIRGGLILKNGNIETNCTFEAVLAQMKPELLNEVAGILFGED